MKEKRKKIRKSRIFQLAEILIFIAICIVTGSSIAYVQHESDPAEQASEYFRAFMQKDYDKMFSYTDREEGYYVNKEMYAAAMKKVRENMVIDTYEIKKTTKIDGKKAVPVWCTDTSTNTTQTMNIYFNSKRKGFQIIPDYYVNIDKMMVKNFSVVMSKNNHLELNGETITKDMAYITTDKEGNTVYNFKAVVNGDYKVAAANNYAALVKNINLIKKDTKTDLTGKDYTANDKYAKLLNDSGSNIMQQFYKAVRERKPAAKKLADCFANNKKLTDKVKQFAEESEDIVYPPDEKNIDKYKVKSFKINNLTSNIKYIQDKKQYILTYKYDYDYTSSTDTALYTSYVYTLSGKCKSEMTLKYELKGDKIVPIDITIENKDKKTVEET